MAFGCLISKAKLNSVKLSRRSTRGIPPPFFFPGPRFSKLVRVATAREQLRPALEEESSVGNLFKASRLRNGKKRGQPGPINLPDAPEPLNRGAAEPASGTLRRHNGRPAGERRERGPPSKRESLPNVSPRGEPS